MQHSSDNRRKYFINSTVQGAILRQVGYFWLAGVATYAFVVFTCRIVPYAFSGEVIDLGRIWYHLAPSIVASAVLLPLVMFIAIRFSHRFVGPMVRFQRTVRQLARGETAAPITLRRHDFWEEFASDLNQLSARFEELSSPEREYEETLVEC
jgi:hypothetical protein